VALPSTRRLRDRLEAQLRREVRLRPGAPLAPTAPGLSFAIYVDTHLTTHAVVVADLAAAAYIGAASALIPVGVATAAVEDHTLPSLLRTRFGSVLEEWGQLFDRAAGTEDAEIRLYDAVLPGGRPPADIATLAAAPGLRLDVTVSVRAYGEGRLSLVLGR
jgi:hypothetical protein